jgi:dGTPase
MAEANADFDLELARWPGLEAQVAGIADDIAYDNHDIDDGLRAGIIDLDELIEVPMVARHWRAIAERHPDIALDRRQRALVRDQISAMVTDVLTETHRRVEEAGVATIDEVRGAGRALVGFSAVLAEEDQALKTLLSDRLYNSPALVPVRLEAQRVVANLAAAYRENPGLLPPDWQTDSDQTTQLRNIGDFIAGMTDRFAIARHEELVGPVELPDRF